VLAQVVESTLIVCEDLGSSPMCATWMLFKLCVFVCFILDACGHGKFLKL